MGTKPGESGRSGQDLLLEAVGSLLEEKTIESASSRLLDKAMEVGQAERGYILLRNAEGRLQPETSRGIEPGDRAEGDPSQTIIDRAIREKQVILSFNAQKDPRFGGSDSLIMRGIRYACCIPLLSQGSLIGALYLDSTRVGRLTQEEAPILQAFGDIAGAALGKMLELDDARKALKIAAGAQRYAGMVGESSTMQRLYVRLERIAAADLPVLITGESGTGKELAARALHQNGPRAKAPLRAIFCGNLTTELLESELFGYRKGAFTGAIADKQGLLDLADKGTLFLDEIADVPAAIQAKLLRFLQEGEYQRLGDPHPRRADVRVLSATNKNLQTEIAAGKFREDLYYRLNVLTIEMPPLRERQGDLPLLSGAILTRVAARTGQPPRKISPAALRKLERYAWPGNVRELENVLARAAVLAAGYVIEPEDIDLPVAAESHIPPSSGSLDLETAVKEHIMKVLGMTGGNRSEAARILGVSRRYIQKSLGRWKEEDNEEEDEDNGG